MENMWLMAQSLGFSIHVLSVFAADAVEKEVKQILTIPEYMKIAYAFRMGHPASKPAKHLRVRRDLEMFTYHNRFGNKDFG
jgi:nitroreductase